MSQSRLAPDAIAKASPCTGEPSTRATSAAPTASPTPQPTGPWSTSRLIAPRPSSRSCSSRLSRCASSSGGRLAELIEERHGRPGVHKLASLIALEPAIIRSDLELHFLPVWRAAGVERPLVNHPIRTEGGTLIVDFCWPDLGVVIELDSQRYHGDWESAERDRERDQLLFLAGRTTHRFTRRQLETAPAGRLRRLLGAHE